MDLEITRIDCILRELEFFHFCEGGNTLRKHAYSNILKILQPKTENFQKKISDIFHISAQNIDCGYSLEPPCRGGSNEYPQSMFASKTRKNNVYPCKPQFDYIKVGFKGGSKLYRRVFVKICDFLLAFCERRVSEKECTLKGNIEEAHLFL